MDGDSTISIIKLVRKVEEKVIGYPDSSHCGIKSFHENSCRQ